MAQYCTGSLGSMILFLQSIRQAQKVHLTASLGFSLDSFPHSTYICKYFCCRKRTRHELIQCPKPPSTILLLPSQFNKQLNKSFEVINLVTQVNAFHLSVTFFQPRKTQFSITIILLLLNQEKEGLFVLIHEFETTSSSDKHYVSDANASPCGATVEESKVNILDYRLAGLCEQYSSCIICTFIVEGTGAVRKSVVIF